MQEIDFNDLRDRAYSTAMKHGWHEEEKRLEHWFCLIIGELAEAVEADRRDRRADYINFEATRYDSFIESFEIFLKDSLEDELADTVIRILDLAGFLNIDLSSAGNDIQNRLYLGHRIEPFTVRIFQIQTLVVKASLAQRPHMLTALIRALFELADNLEIDLLKSIELKMEYNKTRPYKHGKKY